MGSNLCAFCGVFLSALCGLQFLTAENANHNALCGLEFLTAKNAEGYAEFRKVNIQKGLAELKELM